MASPMSWIRKYQKGLMAFFGIILIGIFTITLVLPNGGNVGPVRQRTDDPVVMRWKDGQLKASEISELRFRHYQAMRFLEGLYAYAAEKKQSPITPRVDLIESIDARDPGNVELAEENVVQRFLFAEEAARRGIIVSDDAVDEYLSLMVDNVPITPAELASVNRRVNQQTEYLQIREAIRMELASRQLQIIINPGISFAMNPTQAAQYYTRTSRLIDCEILPYKVEDYLGKVTGSPRVDELQKLYAEGRSHFPDPFDTRAGFKNERKIKLQYFSADFETFLTNEMNKLTDQEVQAEYDRRVQANDMSIMEEVKAEEKKEEAPLPGDDAPQTPPEGEKKEGEQAPAAPAAEGGVNPPAADAPPAEAPATPPADAPKEGDGEKKDGQASIRESVDATFVSFEQNMQEPEKQEPAKEEKPAETAPAETAQEPAAPATEPTAPAEQPAAPQEPAGGQPAAQTPAEPTAPAGENPAAAAQVPTPPVMRPKALKDVADQLKRALKSAAAEEALNAAIEEAQNAVNEFQSELQDWQVTPEKERGPKPTFDPAAIAKRLNLKFEQTELITLRELIESPVGKITHYIRTQVNFAPQTVAQYVAPRFAELQLYREFLFRDVFAADGGTLKRLTYVFWPAEKVEASIPTFEQARPEIEKAWKREQALALAKADAEKAAAESNSSGKKLSEIFGDKAIPTGQFPWFSAGMGSFGYFDIPGVTKPGEEFMQAAFSLQPGKAAVAANDDRSQVYVIRMLSDDTRSTAEMMKQLAENVTPQKPYPESLNSVATTYSRRSFDNWQNQFIDSQKIEWLNR